MLMYGTSLFFFPLFQWIKVSSFILQRKRKEVLLTWSSASVGFRPIWRRTAPSSLELMMPSWSVSKKQKASWNSPICSSVKKSRAIFFRKTHFCFFRFLHCVCLRNSLCRQGLQPTKTISLYILLRTLIEAKQDRNPTAQSHAGKISIFFVIFQDELELFVKWKLVD